MLPFMLKAALPVGAVFTTLTSSGFSPAVEFRYLISAPYNALVTVLLPTPAPPQQSRVSIMLLSLNISETYYEHFLYKLRS